METLQKDQWQLELEKQIQIVQNCQTAHNIESCSKCEKILECNIRDSYVVAVYESMNKGSGGGFEF